MSEVVQEFVKQVAAREQVPVFGLGSGSTAYAVLKEVGLAFKRRGIKPLGIPSSSQIKLLVKDYFTIVEPTLRANVTVDGADQVARNGMIIKGGGGALTREKVLWAMSDEIHVFISREKMVDELTRPLPVEVIPFAHHLFVERARDMGLRPELRADQRGYPAITENGNYIFDVAYQEGSDLIELAERIKGIPGVLEHGLFVFDCNVHII